MRLFIRDLSHREVCHSEQRNRFGSLRLLCVYRGMENGEKPAKASPKLVGSLDGLLVHSSFLLRLGSCQFQRDCCQVEQRWEFGGQSSGLKEADYDCRLDRFAASSGRRCDRKRSTAAKRSLKHTAPLLHDAECRRAAILSAPAEHQDALFTNNKLKLVQ